MKVFLVDDSADFLTGLENLLEAAEIEVVGKAESAAQAVAMLRYLTVDIVLMDIQMPGRSGIVATHQIRQLYPSVKVIMMTVSERNEHLFDAIQAGASGYLLKHLTLDRFPEALEEAWRGDTPLSPGIAAKIMAEFARRSRDANTRSPATPGEFLTPREKMILQLVAEGIPYRTIAERLQLSERTIKYSVREIADKLHLQNRAQLLALASRYLGAEAIAAGRIR